MKNIDKSKASFDTYKDEIIAYKTIDLSESDTRSKLIDEILKSILGWEEENIKREGHTQEGYYDYLIGIPAFKFVIEAKKSFAEFQLPTKHKTATIGTLLKGNSEIIYQIRKYLFEVSVPYGVLTNGHQFIIGKFYNSDGTDWKKNKCVIFNGLEDIESRYIDFYDHLSKFSIIENNGFNIISDELIPSGQKVLTCAPNRGDELIRNPLSAELTSLIDEIFGEIYKYDILDDETLIKECFIENSEIKKNKSEIEKLFADLPPKIENIIPIRNTRNLANSITNEIKDYPIKLKEIAAPKPIIIVGSKGAGKTTFINYLFKAVITDEFKKQRPVIYVDFRNYTKADLFDSNYKIYKDLLNIFYETCPNIDVLNLTALKRIYYQEIERNNKTIWNYDLSNNDIKYNEKLTKFFEVKLQDNENHFIKTSEYLIRERRVRLCIVIDNADQFDTQTQKDVFLFAQSINRRAKCAVIISLREGYYYKWRYQPPFDAFACNVYHVTAPSYSEILQKRINYALANIQVEGKTKGELSGVIKIEFDNTAVRDFLLSIRQSLFGRDNSELLLFLEETTYPNIREGLEIFKNFLLSGHTQVEQYILRQRSSPDSSIPIPFWEFLKAIALYNKLYYNQEISLVNNLFSPAEGSTNHFTKIKVLKYLDSKLQVQGYTEKFVSYKHIIDIFSNAGYKQSVLNIEIKRLLKHHLIETDDYISDTEFDFESNENQSLCISLKGHYYINVLLYTFTYAELTLQDTVIYDDKFLSRLKEVFPIADTNGNRNLRQRLETVKIFMEYLRQQEHKETIESEMIAKNIVQEIYDNGLNNEFKRIERVLASYD